MMWFFGKLSEIWSWLGELSADLFWSTVTSYPAISVMGAFAAVGFVVAHVPAVVQRFLPQLAVYAQAASKVCLVASAMVMFAFGYRVADGRAEIERLKNDLAWSEFQLDQQRQVAEAADELRRQANDEKSTAEEQLRVYRKKFGDNPLAPPPGVIDELRSLQRHPVERRAGATPRGSVRAAVARVRAFGQNRQ